MIQHFIDGMVCFQIVSCIKKCLDENHGVCCWGKIFKFLLKTTPQFSGESDTRVHLAFCDGDITCCY